jgi:hypothetical protein
MNVKQLQRQLGTNLKLRPVPYRIGTDGQTVATPEEQWTLDAILTQPDRVRLIHIATGLSLELQKDNIREYRSPDYLILRCQLTITRTDIRLEPEYSNNDLFKRLETQMPALFAEMRIDLTGHPLRRELVLLKRTWSYWAKGNELFYYFDDHPDLLSQFQILSNHGLVQDITYNNATRYLLSEELATYLGA